MTRVEMDGSEFKALPFVMLLRGQDALATPDGTPALLLRLSCVQVQTPIVQEERWIVEGGLRGESGDILFAEICVWQTIEMSAHDHGFDEF
jgi:hypothetical protein